MRSSSANRFSELFVNTEKMLERERESKINQKTFASLHILLNLGIANNSVSVPPNCFIRKVWSHSSRTGNTIFRLWVGWKAFVKLHFGWKFIRDCFALHEYSFVVYRWRGKMKRRKFDICTATRVSLQRRIKQEKMAKFLWWTVQNFRPDKVSIFSKPPEAVLSSDILLYAEWIKVSVIVGVVHVESEVQATTTWICFHICNSLIIVFLVWQLFEQSLIRFRLSDAFS